jgi:mannosyl-oligosaccharide alpha-1,2-mannosidase
MRRFSSSRLPLLVFILIIILYYWLLTYSPPEYIPQRQPKPQWAQYSWHARKERYPISSSFMMPPSGNPVQIPPIQHSFKSESRQVAKLNRGRREAVKSAFVRGWKGYKEHAWNHDELKPVSGGSQNNFGGWAATLVDSLDTLWIMDLKKEFKEAVRSVGEIDFTRTDAKEINVFETTIRYLGGMLSAYDLSKGKYPLLLEKSLELGEMLYAAFDTPNRMPITRWTWRKYGAFLPLQIFRTDGS